MKNIETNQDNETTTLLVKSNRLKNNEAIDMNLQSDLSEQLLKIEKTQEETSSSCKRLWTIIFIAILVIILITLFVILIYKRRSENKEVKTIEQQ